MKVIKKVFCLIFFLLLKYYFQYQIKTLQYHFFKIFIVNYLNLGSPWLKKQVIKN